MTENNVLEDRLGDTQQMRNFSVHLGTLCRNHPSLNMLSTYIHQAKQTTHLPPLLGIIIRQAENALQRLHRQPGLLCCDRQIPHNEHALPIRSVKPQLDLRLHLFLVRHLRVVHEGATAGVRRLIARRGVLETLDDGRLATPVVSYNDGDGREELDDGDLFVVKGTYASDGKLVETRHGSETRMNMMVVYAVLESASDTTRAPCHAIRDVLIQGLFRTPP